MPSGDRLDKKIPMDDESRLELLKIVKSRQFANTKRLRISRFELAMLKPTNTFDTWQALCNRFPDRDFWFVFGRDSYCNMPSWPHGDELRKSLQMVLFGDGTGKIPQASNIQYIQLGIELADISATKVRKALARGQPVDGFVSAPVAGYLRHLF
jgi:nicotinic acid mononucleotide adenylyltransferase